MKHLSLLLLLTLALLAGSYTPVVAQEKSSAIVRVIRVNDHWRAIQLHYRPDPQRLSKQAHVAEPAVNTNCSYDFFGETCEYDPPTGFILCVALYWSESCQQGQICYNWYGDCGIGCSLGGECVPVDSTWLLN